MPDPEKIPLCGCEEAMAYRAALVKAQALLSTDNPVWEEIERVLQLRPDLLSPCPRCQRPMLELRHTGFSPGNLERQRQCYRWADDKFTCNNPPARFRPLLEELPRLAEGRLDE